MTPEQMPVRWCRMWNEDASLAHRLVADGGRQWSAQTPGLDQVVGPAETEAFVRKYQRDVGNLFAPRTLVVDGADRVAYTWDVTHRDGTVRSGADVNVLRDGLVVANWTSVSQAGRSPLPDGPGAGELDRAALAAAVAGAHPWHGDLVVDVARQTVAGTWSDGTRGGIAVLVLVDGRIDRQWVLPGDRPLPTRREGPR
ncbi:hypothetical protein [Actinoplanes subtropicus]|uniref:hypothetical protein n=1 Tax=Actinoplanes subtropicus TaxID=543632 RepID=UPI00068AA722|nr:hypothetical protein [Actinoplanes subtropicus]